MEETKSTPIYQIGVSQIFLLGQKVHLKKPIQKNWWVYDVVSRSDFEDAEHTLVTYDDRYKAGKSDQAPDICAADNSVWAFSELAWGLLPELEASGCRIAHNVRVERGNKKFKLVYPAAVLDLLDHNLGYYSWNGGLISAVSEAHLYAWDGIPPLMFKVLLHHKEEYRGVTKSPYRGTFVSAAFKQETEQRKLTGIDFFEVPRSSPPQHQSKSGVIVYTP